MTSEEAAEDAAVYEKMFGSEMDTAVEKMRLEEALERLAQSEKRCDSLQEQVSSLRAANEALRSSVIECGIRGGTALSSSTPRAAR